MLRHTILPAAAVAASLIGLGVAQGAARATPATPPAAFGGPVDNAYLPYVPGTTRRYEGLQGGRKAVDTETVTHETRVVAGVTCVVVHQHLTLDGKPEERTTDWYAQDKQGNVWYFGEDSFDYRQGRWEKNAGSWRAGVDGARPGIVMQAKPRVGQAYAQESYPGHAADHARVLATGASLKLPFRSFAHVVVTQEWTPLEPGVIEEKSYAPGIGEVHSVMVEGGSEELHLVSVSHGG